MRQRAAGPGRPQKQIAHNNPMHLCTGPRSRAAPSQIDRTAGPGCGDSPARAQAVCRTGERRPSGRALAGGSCASWWAETAYDPMHQSGGDPGGISDRTPCICTPAVPASGPGAGEPALISPHRAHPTRPPAGSFFLGSVIHGHAERIMRQNPMHQGGGLPTDRHVVSSRRHTAGCEARQGRPLPFPSHLRTVRWEGPWV